MSLEERQAVGLRGGAQSQEDHAHRRYPSPEHQFAEILVCRENHTLLLDGHVQQGFVREARCDQFRVNAIMSGLLKEGMDRPADVSVGEDLHAEDTSSSRRKRAAAKAVAARMWSGVMPT